jgi:uncharacterized protein YjbI with pentapeptide repeats
MAGWHDPLGKRARRAHAAWLKRGRVGDGRIDLTNETLCDLRRGGNDWTAARLVGCHFVGSRVEYTDLIEAELIDCTIERSEFGACHFERARIERLSSVGIPLVHNKFMGATIIDCDMSGSRFARGDFSGAHVERTKFRAAWILDARLDGAEFTDCDFTGADLTFVDPSYPFGTTRGTRFTRCDLRDTKWDGRILDGTVFEACRFHGVTGKAKLAGPVTVVAPDFSPAGDGSDIRDAAAVLALLGLPPTAA